jgi:hypothetical protein
MMTSFLLVVIDTLNYIGSSRLLMKVNERGNEAKAPALAVH